MAGKVYVVMALVMIACVLQAGNANESKPTQNPKLECFRKCSIECGKQNKPCYQDCLTICGLPQRPPTPTTSSSPSSNV
ncbi:hypothetical protein N665_0157s0008 [Sinapis alba]|nr:hypothetical protein N665_0157s0008 [Sinapis alba]